MQEFQNIESLVDAIYDAAGDAERWPHFLSGAARLLESESAQIGHIDLQDRSFSFLITYGTTFTEERIRQYQALMPEDPRLAYMTERPFLPAHCRMVLTDEELHSSRLYREVLAPDGIEYTLGVNLVEETKSTTFFTAHRGLHQPVFGTEECQLLGELVPHLRRALRLYHVFAAMDLQHTAARDALDQIPLGVFIVRPDGEFVFGNRMAGELLAAGADLRLLDGKLGAATPETTRVIRAALMNVMTEPEAEPQALVLERPGQLPLRVLVSPIGGVPLGQTLVRQKGDLAAIYVNDPTRAHEAPWERLQHMFGLFPSEAKLVAEMVSGASVVDAGAKLGLTAGSSRQYLKNVLSKTGTHSQSELLLLVMKSPVWMS